MSRNVKSKSTVPCTKPSRVVPTRERLSKKPFTKPPVPVRQGLIKKKPILKTKTTAESKKPTLEQGLQRNDSLQMRQKASTPLGTPLKCLNDALKAGNDDKDIDALSNISKESAPSSVCSSVSSGLIQLLSNYNSKGDNVNVPEKDSSTLDDTLKNEDTFSFVIPTDRPNYDGRVSVLTGLLEKLKSTANSILSSGDSRNVKRLEKLVETMSKEFDGLKSELPALWVQKREFVAEVEAIVSPLKAENASLQRKIRILNQNLTEIEKQNQTDINLELETVQCMNNTLLAQVNKLSSLLQEAQDTNKKLEDAVSRVKAENRKMTEDILQKNKEFSKSQELFSSEAGNIKTEVANALQAVDLLKDQLRQAEKENELLKVTVDEKEKEILRLDDLNKGLQSSVSRLVDDLQEARPRLERSANRKASSAILKNIEHVLNTPKEKPSDESFFDDLDYRPNHLTRSYPLPSGKENSIPPFMQNPVQNLYKSHMAVDDYDNMLESSRLSTIPPSDHRSTTMDSYSSGMRNHAGSHIGALPDQSKMRQWDQNSVCSSFVSFTTTDENNFADGLALLDANIKRLQNSLHDMSGKPS